MLKQNICFVEGEHFCWYSERGDSTAKTIGGKPLGHFQPDILITIVLLFI